MTRRPLGAQISHMLRDRGVDVIFGIPGVHNQEMYRGIEEAGITHFLARHEQGAGFMADGYARATGRVGVCYVITGPGVCNIMTPMGQAYSDSVPMLVISSCLDETAAMRGQLHQMKDQQGAAATVCDWSETARTPQAAYRLIDRALSEQAHARPRPKHITVPIAQLEAEAPAAPVAPAGSSPECGLQSCDLKAVADQLRAAKRPLFVLGGGAVRAQVAINSVLSNTGAASFETYAGNGIVTGDGFHFGSLLARPASAEIFAQADLLVLAGTDLAEVDLWRASAGHDCPSVVVNIDPEVAATPHQQNLTYHIDCAAFFAALAKQLGEAPSQSEWSARQVTDFRARMRSQIATERPGILPVADVLRAALPVDTMIYSDMTQFAYAAMEVWPMSHAGHWHHPSGFGTLGYALPAAIGGKIGRPDGPVVAIAGDYGFQFTIQELMVAVEQSLSVPIILWDNGKLGEIEASMVSAQIAPNAVVQHNPDFCLLAQAYGAAYTKPASLSQVSAAVTAALNHAGPTVIHIGSDIA